MSLTGCQVEIRALRGNWQRILEAGGTPPVEPIHFPRKKERDPHKRISFECLSLPD
ncbi:hypothetical protein SAMN04488030_1388 [Aliiroseovarius halocynthiae]|nr:hypothetical protein SAMN04488030_1388 [Aliiroseovarius halocynthiae]